MLKMFVVAALLAVPVIAPQVVFAAEAPRQSFVYQGVTYVYTAEVKDGVRTLRGTAANGTMPFELKVTKAGVVGSFDQAPVSFDLHEVEHLAGKDVIANQ